MFSNSIVASLVHAPSAVDLTLEAPRFNLVEVDTSYYAIPSVTKA